MSNKVHTVIVGHGSFPQGIITAAEKIVGRQEGVILVSNDGLGIGELSEKIRQVLTNADNEVYVFIDLVGGSCFSACRTLMPECPSWVFIAGLNLPMLVTFFSYRKRLSGKALVRKTLEAGQRGIEQFFCINHQ